METKKFTSGNEVVDRVGEWNLRGNIIPHEWYINIRDEKGKADYLSVLLLAEIVYWHRPRQVDEPNKKNTKIFRPKFSGDKLHKKYSEFAEKFGASKKQVTQSIFRLKKKGLLDVEYRNIIVKGMALNNLTYFTPICENIEKITGAIVDFEPEKAYSPTGIDHVSLQGEMGGPYTPTGIDHVSPQGEMVPPDADRRLKDYNTKEDNTNTNTPLTPHGGNDAKTNPSPSRSDVDVEDLDNHVVSPPLSKVDVEDLDNYVVTPPPSKETTVFSEASDSLQSPALPSIDSSGPPSYANGFDPPCVDGDDEGVDTPPESSSDDLFSVPSPDEDPTPSSASPPPRKSANDKMVVDDPIACRIASWFGHRPGYKWRRKEYLAFEDAVPGTSDSDLRMLEKFYSFRGVYNGSPTYARRELYTLFNHWQGEINKAREFLSTHGMLAEFVEEREEMSAFEKFDFHSTPPLRDFRDNEPDEALDAMFKGVLASFKEDFPKEACIAQ